MKLPDFLIIGAAKCGTTSLYYYLRQNPEVFLPRIKEINYFAYHGQKGRFWAKTLEEYGDFFKDAGDEKVVGEVTPLYFASEEAAKKIKETIPDVKIVAILRNPVDRAYSHYNMYVRSGKEKRSPEEALLDETSLYTRVGFYYRNLRKYFEIFNTDKIKIFFYDDFVASPAELVKELFEFIGVDSSFELNLQAKHASGYLPKNKLLNKLFDNYFTRFVIKPLLPEKILELGMKIKNINSRRPEKLSSIIRTLLSEIYKDDIKLLEKLVNRKLTNWYV